MNKLTFLLLASITFNVLADPQAVDIKQGVSAPFTGILINPELDAKVKADLQAYDTLKLIDASNKRIIDALKAEVDINTDLAAKWRKEAEVQAKARESANRYQFWKSAGFFTGGTVVTILLAFAVNRVTK